jgi:hypothetical protein
MPTNGAQICLNRAHFRADQRRNSSTSRRIPLKIRSPESGIGFALVSENLLLEQQPSSQKARPTNNFSAAASLLAGEAMGEGF